MKKMLDWFNEEENRFFATHVVAIFLAAIIVESFESRWTTLTFPAIVLLGAASFLWYYPVKAIKSHGLFSEYLIELRLLWLVVAGLLSEAVVYGVLDEHLNPALAAVGIAAGLLVAFFARSRLQERIVESRGFK